MYVWVVYCNTIGYVQYTCVCIYRLGNTTNVQSKIIIIHNYIAKYEPFNRLGAHFACNKYVQFYLLMRNSNELNGDTIIVHHVLHHHIKCN